MNHNQTLDKEEALKEIIEEGKHRPILPFIGAGISISAGLPSIKLLIQYLAKTIFAIDFGIIGSKGTEGKRGDYKQFLEGGDGGWPNIGELNEKIWDWLKNDGLNKIRNKEKNINEGALKTYSDLEEKLHQAGIGAVKDWDSLSWDLTQETDNLDYRDSLHAIVQWVLRRELDDSMHLAMLREWCKYKAEYDKNKDKQVTYRGEIHGDWQALLNKLCGGDQNLADTLFSSLEKDRQPTQSHLYLSFLQSKLDIPLLFTTNFDTLLEQAFVREKRPLKIFDIHKDAPFPVPNLVKASQPTLIKLHGSSYGLRLGERLHYTFEEESRNRVLNYLPKNSNPLILVMGFNGSELRMIEMLKAFIQEAGKKESEGTTLIWLQGPGTPGPEAKPLLKNKRVKKVNIQHLDTLLQELYFHLTHYSYHTSLPGYPITPSHPMIPDIRPYSEVSEVEFTQADKRKPVHFFISDSKETASSSWSYLSWISFIRTLDYSYNVIRINLDKHHTLEGVITDLFNRAGIIDPQWQNQSDITLPNFGNADSFEKIIHEVFRILKRNRCILVFDMLESFCRPLMVHHGLASQSKAALEQVQNLKEFFFKIIKRNSNDFCDSYVIITIGEPFFRYHTDRPRTGEKNKLYYELVGLRDEFIEKSKGKNSCKVNLQSPNEPHTKIHSKYFFKPTKNSKSATKLIKDHWKNPEPDPKSLNENDWMERSKKRANDIISLLHGLRTKEEDLCKENTLHALIALLSLFRRTRTTPLLHGMLTRWAFRPILNSTIDAETAKERRQAFNIELRNLMTDESSLVGPVSQDHEGGNIWLFRTVNTRLYEALTENLRLRNWVRQENDTNQFKNDEKNHTPRLALDAVLSISWHLLAARAYYVDVLLPSQDINAFWEYLYHRVSAIRTIALLIFALKEGSDVWTNLEEVCNEFNLDESDLRRDLTYQGIKNSFVKYITLIGLFDSLTPTAGQDKIRKVENQTDFEKKLVKLQVTSLKTLLSAFKKNALLFRSTTASESVLACAEQFLNKELKNMQLISNGETNSEEITNLIEELRTEFTILQYQALHAQEAYDNVIKIHGENIDIDEVYRTDIDPKNDLEKFLNKVSKNNQPSNHPLTTIQSLSFISQALVEKHTANGKISDEDYTKTEKLTQILVTITENSDVEGSNNLPNDAKSWAISRKLVAHNLHCRFLLGSKFLMWKYSPNRTEESSLLRNLEQKIIAFERLIREETETPRTDALHRSNAFMMLARVYYLQNDFVSANHYLNLAMVGLHQDYIEHRTQLSRIHIYRAELLYFSSHSNGDNETNEARQKIKKAQQILEDAKSLVNDINHSNKQKQLLKTAEKTLSQRYEDLAKPEIKNK